MDKSARRARGHCLESLEQRALFSALPFTTQGVDFAVGPMYADRITNDVYVANTTSNTIIKFDTSTGDTVGAAALASTPSAITENKNGRRIFVSETAADQVQVIATSTMTVLKTLSLSFAPGAVTFGVGSELYIANTTPDNNSRFDVEQYNLTSGTIIDASVATFVYPPVLSDNKTCMRLFGIEEQDSSANHSLQRIDIAAPTTFAVPSIPTYGYGIYNFYLAGGQGNLYSSSFGLDGIDYTKISTSAESVWNYPTGSDYCMAVTSFPGSTSVYGADRLPSIIYQFDQSSGTIENSYAVGSLEGSNYALVPSDMVETANGDIFFASATIFTPFTYAVGEIGLSAINFTDDTPAVANSAQYAAPAGGPQAPAGIAPADSLFASAAVIAPADRVSLG